MASTNNHLFLSIILFTTIFPSKITHGATQTYLLPIVKDITTPQYYTTFLVGTPQTRVYLAIDLGNLWSWFTCDIVGFNHSSTFHPLSCDALKCTVFGRFGCVGCPNGPLKPSCTPINTCGAIAYSPQSNKLYSAGIIEDVISIYNQNSTQPIEASLRDFPFICASEKGPLKGLSPFTKGILTLARRPNALHAQISSRFKLPHKFALCLPGTSDSGINGAMYFGGGPYHLPSTSAIDLSKSLVTTPLIINPNSTAPIYTEEDPSIEFFINIRSIKVDGTPLRFKQSLLSFDKDGVGGTKISTLDPYTILQSEIYKSLIDIFVAKAATLKITRVVPSIAPFGACFNAKSILSTKKGPIAPNIDLIFNEKSAVLHNKIGRWRINGANSLVKVANKDVLCLGFVDGGLAPRTSIVIGGKQMEDNLIEFDLVGNKLGVTSSLLQMGTTCSQIKGI